MCIHTVLDNRIFVCAYAACNNEWKFIFISIRTSWRLYTHMTGKIYTSARFIVQQCLFTRIIWGYSEYQALKVSFRHKREWISCTEFASLWSASQIKISIMTEIISLSWNCIRQTKIEFRLFIKTLGKSINQKFRSPCAINRLCRVCGLFLERNSSIK